MLLKHAFGSSTKGVYLQTRSDGNLFNPSRIKAKRKERRITICGMLFADDDAVVAHSEYDLQALMDSFANAYEDFGLTISKADNPRVSVRTTPLRQKLP